MKRTDINDMDKISNEFEIGSDRTNNGRVTSPFKIACEYSTGHVFSRINFKLSQSDVLDKMSVKFKTGLCGVTRSNNSVVHRAA